MAGRFSLRELIRQVNPQRLLVLAAVVWTIGTLGAALYGYWSVQHSALCFDQTGTGPFCRYHAMTSAAYAAGGPLVAYAVGTVLLGIAWLLTMNRREPCPDCGAPSRNDMGGCRRCGYDPFASIAREG